MAMRREQVAAALKYLQDKADLRGRLQRATSLDPQEQDLADIAVETGASLVPGVGPALAARDFERARRADDEAGMAMAAAGAIPGGKLAKLLKGFDPTRLELDVYHGTPHRFPATEANPLGEFDASKIGTGEGAQAYGHGSYFAENPNVAEGYRKTLGEQQNPYKANVAMSRMAALVDEFDGDVEKAADRFMQSVYETPKTKAKMRQNLIDEFQTYSPKGQLYKADLPDEMIDRMLDWDKPLSEQPAIFQELMKMTDLTGTAGYIAKTPETTTFGELYQALTNQIPQKDVSEYFRNAGIPGIKYLDAGSRGQGGSGTRNFVVFPGEEKKVKILERD